LGKAEKPKENRLNIHAGDWHELLAVRKAAEERAAATINDATIRKAAEVTKSSEDSTAHFRPTVAQRNSS
jgi:hypothetical protein